MDHTKIIPISRKGKWIILVPYRMIHISRKSKGAYRGIHNDPHITRKGIRGSCVGQDLYIYIVYVQQLLVNQHACDV